MSKRVTLAYRYDDFVRYAADEYGVVQLSERQASLLLTALVLIMDADAWTDSDYDAIEVELSEIADRIAR